MKNRVLRYAIRILSILLILSMYGCRESSALQQVIYTQDSQDVDDSQNELSPEDEGQEDDQFNQEEIDDSDVDRDTDDSLAEHDNQSLNQDEDVNVDYSQTGSNTATASSKSNNQLTSSNASLTAQTQQDTTSENTSQTSGEDTGGGTQAEENPENKEAGPKQTVTDGYGKEIEIPTDAQKVAAVGAAAAMVEMVAGEGHLEYTNTNFIQSENNIAQQIFANDLNNITQLWAGDGSTALNSSSFETLLQSDITVCFYFSGENTFSNSQLEQLSAAGITCVALYSLKSTSDLKNNVTIIATAFQTATNNNSMSISQQYGSWVDGVVSKVSTDTNNSSLYSVYISGWSSTSYTFTNGKYYLLPDSLSEHSGSGSGVATAWSYHMSQLITTFMNTAHISNEATTVGVGITSTSVYVTPMFHQFNPSFSDSSISYFSQVVAGDDAFVTHKEGSTTVGLGSSAFPAIIVANKTIKSNIQNNWFWQYHGEASNTPGGYEDPVTKETLSGSIYQNYEIYVNPSGIGDWAKGSVESPLEAYWVAYALSGTYSLATVKDQVSEFYATFYNYTLSEQQLNTILQIDENGQK